MFQIDDRLETTCFRLGNWPLSIVLLKNDQRFPWLILVPQKENIQEMYQLEQQERHVLMDEIVHLSQLSKHYFKADKINVGSLGNIVSQLHVHVVARFEKDSLWPQGIWQDSSPATPYSETSLDQLIKPLSDLIHNAY